MRKCYAIVPIIFLLISNLFSQIQITVLPSSGFEARIRKAVNEIQIIDTHEHLLTEAERLNMADRIDFTYLFSHYAKEDLISASNLKGIIDVVFNPAVPLADRWELFKPFYEAIRCTGYGRVPLIIANDLYGIAEINDQTYAELSDKIREATKPGLYRWVLKEKAGIELSIMDGGHRKFDKEFYRHVERFDHFVHIFSGTKIRQLGKQYNIEVKTLKDYLAALRKAFLAGVECGMVGVKSALAYNRIIKYENVPEQRAKAVFDRLLEGESNQPAPTHEDVKALQDYMMHRVLDLAKEFELPVQIHTGLLAGNGNWITNSNPTHLTNLFMEYPEVNFCIFHSSYPYGGELSALAKNFPNVFIDMCWSYVISPSYSERYLHEWIETVPANKIMAFGGDYSIVEAVYAHAMMARKVIAKVLIEKVRTGYMTEAEALDIARRILRDNAMEIFRLNGRSRGVDNIAALKRPGRLHDWWEIHRTKTGFIRHWMVIGPFEFGNGLDDVYPPEKEIKFDKSYAGIGGDVSWEKVVTSKGGYLNFISFFSKKQPAGSDLRGMAYAYAEIESPDDREATITLGSNDGAKIWLNGRVIYNLHVGRSAIADQEFLKVKLRKGVNKILAKVENLGANWGLYMRLVDPTGKLRILEWID